MSAVLTEKEVDKDLVQTTGPLISTPVDTAADTAADTAPDTAADTAPDTAVDTAADTAPDTAAIATASAPVATPVATPVAPPVATPVATATAPAAPPKSIKCPPSTTNPVTKLFNGLFDGAKDAITDAKARLKSGSLSEVVIAGERVRLDQEYTSRRHPDIAPISLYLDPPMDEKIKVLRTIFSGTFDSENPIPPCNANDKSIIMSALNKRLRSLDVSIAKRREALSDNVKTHEMIRHYRRIEAMLDALQSSEDCEPYGEAKADVIDAKTEERLRELVRQFAFLVLQGVDPINLTGPLKAKSSSAIGLVKLLSNNKITEEELEEYMSLRKTIPLIIINILDKDGASAKVFEEMIEQRLIQEQEAIVEAIATIIRGNDTLVPSFNSFYRDLADMPPKDKIIRIVQWLVDAYVLQLTKITELNTRVDRLTDEHSSLELRLNAVQEESANLRAERDAATAYAANAEGVITGLTAERDTEIAARQEAEAKMQTVNGQIQVLTDELGTTRDALNAARASIAQAASIQSTLNEVSEELNRVKSENKSMSERIGALEAEKAALAAEIATLTADLATANSDVAAAKAELAALNESRETEPTVAEMADLQAKLSAAESTVASTEAALAKAKEDLEAKQNELATTAQRMNETIARLTSEKEDADRTTALATNELAVLRASLASKQDDVAGRLQTIAAAELELGRLTDSIQGLQAKLTESENGKQAALSERDALRARYANYDSQLADAQRAIQAKVAEIQGLQLSARGGQEDISDLSARAKRAEEALAAETSRKLEIERQLANEQRNTEKARGEYSGLLGYLEALSTAIANDTELPSFGGNVPKSLSDIFTKVRQLKGKTDSTAYTCILAYYVNVFMTLIFSQPHGDYIYNRFISPAVDKMANTYGGSYYDVIAKLTRALSYYEVNDASVANDSSITSLLRDNYVANADVGEFVGAVIKDIRKSPLIPRVSPAPGYLDILALFVVASQKYLKTLKMPCEMPNGIKDPSSLFKRSVTPAPFVYNPPAREVYSKEPSTRDILMSSFSPAQQPSPAAARTFDVEDKDERFTAPKLARPTPGDAISDQQAAGSLGKVKSLIKAARGAHLATHQEKMQFKTERNRLDAYCSYGKQPKYKQYPDPDVATCSDYGIQISSMPQSARDKLL